MKTITTIRWKPIDCQIYWIVSDHGTVFQMQWRESIMDYRLLEVGNCYPTKRKAEEIAELVKLAYKK